MYSRQYQKLLKFFASIRKILFEYIQEQLIAVWDTPEFNEQTELGHHLLFIIAYCDLNSI